MYTLCKGIWKRITEKKNYFIVIVGLDNAGKTTFLEQTKMKFTAGYKMLNPLRITSTVGLNVGEIDIGSVRLNFWDLGGQEDLRSLWHQYFQDSQALVFVVDSSDVSRFGAVAKAFNQIMASQAVQKMPVLVVCNKSDLEDCASVEEISHLTVDDRHVGDFALIPVSALQGLNVDRCIRWLYTTLSKSIEHS
uniref:ADP-ribosylation factor-related protein 1 n=1 Tax=Syphacia muris TaxID=451379 RepID=A0A0N5AFH5_9BILA